MYIYKKFLDLMRTLSLIVINSVCVSFTVCVECVVIDIAVKSWLSDIQALWHFVEIRQNTLKASSLKLLPDNLSNVMQCCFSAITSWWKLLCQTLRLQNFKKWHRFFFSCVTEQFCYCQQHRTYVICAHTVAGSCYCILHKQAIICWKVNFFFFCTLTKAFS